MKVVCPLVICFLVLLLNSANVSAQMTQPSPAQIASCRSQLDNRVLSWNRTEIWFDSNVYRSGVYTVIPWTGPGGQPAGTCVVDDSGWVQSLNTYQNMAPPIGTYYVPMDVPSPLQLEGCRVIAEGTLPGLMWSQVIVEPVTYPDGTTTVYWNAPGGPSGTCVVDESGTVQNFQFN